jgi:peptide deformylase
MAVLEILEAPHPVLSSKARTVGPAEFGQALQQRLDDLAETMYAAPGVGLAAPQVGDSRRILVADPGNEDEEGNVVKGPDLVCMVNPEIIERSRANIIWEESCLSVPGFYVDVKRARKVKVRWQDAEGALHEREFEEFSAVVVQHELDHLSGITLLSKSSRLKRSRYMSRRRKAGKLFDVPIQV